MLSINTIVNNVYSVYLIKKNKWLLLNDYKSLNVCTSEVNSFSCSFYVNVLE